MTGVGEHPFICICADGFGGDTCNVTETGTSTRSFFFFRSTYLSDTLIDLFFSAFFLQDPAVLTPVPTMGRARSSLPPDEETFSTSTSASASPASRERTAKSVGLRLDVINESDLLHLSCAHKQLLHFHSHQTIFEFYSQLHTFTQTYHFLRRYRAIYSKNLESVDIKNLLFYYLFILSFS